MPTTAISTLPTRLPKRDVKGVYELNHPRSFATETLELLENTQSGLIGVSVVISIFGFKGTVMIQRSSMSVCNAVLPHCSSP
jgi:hypothetical protein